MLPADGTGCCLRTSSLRRTKKSANSSKTLPQPLQKHALSLSEDTNKEQLFLHMEYGQNDIPRKAVREIYDSTCREVFEEMGIKKFVIAYSRSNNIKELMTRAKLHQAPGHEASKYYTGELAAEW